MEKFYLALLILLAVTMVGATIVYGLFHLRNSNKAKKSRRQRQKRLGIPRSLGV